MIRTFLVIAFIFFITTDQTRELYGRVVDITDGDTVKLLKEDNTTVKIRVANIDCPERKQPFSTKAKQFTSDAIFSKRVKIQVLKTDRYGRLVANIIYDGGLNLCEELLKAGMAWHYKRYSKDKYLQKLENVARLKKVGLWQDPKAVAPWEWRRKGYKKK
jgi:endonuclease YncB( thermonuclease family)